MSHADALSRLPLSSLTKIGDNSINRLMLNDCPVRFEILKASQYEDRTISQIINYVKVGWPKQVTTDLKYYYNLRNEFSLEDNCLFYHDRIVVPTLWKEAVLKVLHSCHTGIVRMKMISRSYVWWPSMNTDIENYSKSCLNCQQTQNIKKEVVVTKWKNCTYPFERVHIDFFHLDGKVFFITVDAYSKFIDLKLMNKTNAAAVLRQLDNLFSYFGLPTEIVSDNGPPFNSYEFENYCQSLGIKVTKTPPYHAQSNGLGERGVQTCKSVLKKMLIENKDINEVLPSFLFHYRNTPSTVTGKSPSELMFSYKTRAQLSLVNPKANTNKKSYVSQNNNNQYKNTEPFNKQHSNSTKYENYMKCKVIFSPGEKVLYRNHFRCDIKWIPATVIKQVSPTTYLIQYFNHRRFVQENQIRRSTLADKFHPLVDIPIHSPDPNIANSPNSSKHKRKKLSPVIRAKKRRLPLPVSYVLRRSKRVKRKVIRFDPASNNN